MATDNCTSLPSSTVNTKAPLNSDFLTFWNHAKAEPTYVILGVQGSGTNLLCRLLKRCFRVSAVRDRSLVIQTGTSLIADPSATHISEALQHVHKCLFPNRIQKRLLPRRYYRQADEYDGIEKYFSRVMISSPAEFCSFLYSYQCFRTGGAHRAVKSDDIWQFLGQIEHTIPNRRYIRLVRDPRDNALSITNKDWGPIHPYAAAQFVARQSRIYDRCLNDAPSIVIKYEDILTTPEDVARAFSQFSGIRPVNDLATSIETLQIRGANKEKWRRLSPRQLAATQHVLKDQITSYGYKLHPGDTAGLTFRLLYRLEDVARRVPQKLRTVIRRRITHG